MSSIPTPYAGSYYPIYNSGVKQYIPPTTDMPFNEITTLIVAFAHAYPTEYEGDSPSLAALALEAGQQQEPFRLVELVAFAKAQNPNIKILISLGWGMNDWDYISADYKTYQAGVTTNFNFAQSIVDLIRTYKLDGFDIDDESTGMYDQDLFDGIVSGIRSALNAAGTKDGKPYYFTITPAGGTGMITTDNLSNFDVVNTQNYGNSSWQDFSNAGFPDSDMSKFALGVDSEDCVSPKPSKDDVKGLAGAFNWTLSADSACGYAYTTAIATAVGIPTT